MEVHRTEGARGRRLAGLLAAATVAIVLVAAAQAQAATFTVNTTTDNAATGTECMGVAGDCGLRQAIDKANSATPPTTIVVPAGFYGLTNGQLTITQNVTINGASARTTTVSQETSSPTSRVVEIRANATSGFKPTVTISGVELSFGNADSTSPTAPFGGDVLNEGNLTLGQDLITEGNTSAGSGAGISNDGGTLTVSHSLVYFNGQNTISGTTTSTTNDSGGIQNYGPNPATGAAGTLVVTNSTIVSNAAAQGGGIMSWNNSGNTATVTDSTIAFNDGGPRTSAGGGLRANDGGSISVQNSIVADNTVDSPATGTASNCAAGGSPTGSIKSASHNLDSGADCSFAGTGDLKNTDPMFFTTQFTGTGAPQDWGGGTDLLALDAKSPAVDAIPAGTSGCSGTDQAGTGRPQGAGCDIGAYEAVQPVEGQSKSIEVAPANCGGVPPVTVSWGDGTSSAGSVSSDGNRLLGTHSFTEEGVYNGSVSYSTSDCNPETVTFNVKVADAPLTSTPTSVGATAGVSLSRQVATFTDADPNGTASDYTATVNWGDGTSSAGTVTGPTPFVVNGTHTYASSGTFTVTATIHDAGGATATATTTATVVPAVTGLNPSSGPSGGGTTVTITGSGLAGASAVRFGSVPAASFTIISPTQISAVSPAGSGMVDVTVTTPGGTSATSAADRFAYQTTPSLTPGAPSVLSSTSAAFTATIDPEGLGTSVQFQYGAALPASADTGQVRSSAGVPFTYSSTTPSQSLPADFASHTVTATVTGLLPNTLYHVRVVATNSAGAATGSDQTLMTLADPPPPPPVLGKTIDASVVSGLVLVQLPHGQHLYSADRVAHQLGAHLLPRLTTGAGYVPLTEARALPTGTKVDARLGTIALNAATGQHKKTQKGNFNGGIFGLAQTRNGKNKGLTTLSLLESAFTGAPTYKSCTTHKSADRTGPAAHAALSSKVLQTLHAKAHGRFRTSGRYSAATVRGTIWTISDKCNGTLTTVQTDSVAVEDFTRHKTIIIHAHHSYLAKPPTKKHK